MNKLIVIAARKGSQRIPNKNRKFFNGIRIIDQIFYSALFSGFKTIVSE